MAQCGPAAAATGRLWGCEIAAHADCEGDSHLQCTLTLPLCPCRAHTLDFACCGLFSASQHRVVSGMQSVLLHAYADGCTVVCENRQAGQAWCHSCVQVHAVQNGELVRGSGRTSLCYKLRSPDKAVINLQGALVTAGLPVHRERHVAGHAFACCCLWRHSCTFWPLTQCLVLPRWPMPMLAKELMRRFNFKHLSMNDAPATASAAAAAGVPPPRARTMPVGSSYSPA